MLQACGIVRPPTDSHQTWYLIFAIYTNFDILYSMVDKTVLDQHFHCRKPYQITHMENYFHIDQVRKVCITAYLNLWTESKKYGKLCHFWDKNCYGFPYKHHSTAEALQEFTFLVAQHLRVAKAVLVSHSSSQHKISCTAIKCCKLCQGKALIKHW